ncbi:MAG: NAD(P)-dependent oxidoreductase [Rhodanobacteraceae bacterium]
MIILVTGAGGFLGTHICESLLDAGCDDLRMHFRNKPPDGRVAALQARYANARITTVSGNLLGRGRLEALVANADCIVHAAAALRGSTADMFANTVVGTRNLLEAACAASVRRIVLISSFSVYRTESLTSGALHDESLEVEAVGAEKGAYAYAKTRQEHLFEEFRQRFNFESAVLRPGVIYGPGGSPFSSRVGIRAFGLFFALGGRATLPLSYVENCADAVACAALHAPNGGTYNVVDDDLPSCREYLRQYRRAVGPLRTLPVPYGILLLGARMLVRYYRKSKGQLPAVFTPYTVRSMYRPLRYSNAALKKLGWRQHVPTAEGLARSFRYWREHQS